jgi:hypothetical protein
MSVVRPSSNDALPIHLTENPPRKGLSRLSVGTTVFNAMAVLMLISMSAFVVIGSAYAPDEPIEQTGMPVGPEPNYELALEGAARMAAATTTTAAPTTTTEPPPTTEAAKPVARAARAPAPPTTAPKPVTCDRFATQPEAQAVFDQDPAGHVGFDGDGDGVACEHLPGRPEAPAAPPPFIIPTKADLVRPTTRLYGVHTRESPYAMHEVDAFTASVGKAPNNILFFSTFEKPFPADAVENSWNAGMLPLVTLEPTTGDPLGNPSELQNIIDGKWDAYFTEWAAAAKANGKPIALRFAHEMNGNWYSWSGKWTNWKGEQFGNANEDYIAAWRHVHDLFDSVGADNVLWVWSVTRVDVLRDKTLGRLYPGDAYVDWVGISGYYRDASTTPTFDTTYAATLAELKKVAPKKPIMLTEIGVGTTEQNRVAWLNSFFEALLDHQEIIGFAWFNDFKDGGDWQIQFSQATTAAFAAGVADPRYGEIARRPGA